MKQLIKNYLKRFLPNVFTHNALTVSTPPELSLPRTISHQVTYSDGIVKNVLFQLHNKTEVFRLEHWGGEQEYVQDLISQLSVNDVFYDIGSSVGLISIHAAMKISKGIVYSFEPDPENTLHLEENYKLNNLSNYRIIKGAVGNKKGEMTLFTAGANALSPSLRKVNKIDTSIEVLVHTIDDLIEAKTIEAPTVVKIDIEGAEMMALEGMAELLASSRKPRKIYLEIHPDFLQSFNTNITDILAFLFSKNYLVTKIIGRSKQLLCEFEPKP